MPSTENCLCQILSQLTALGKILKFPVVAVPHASNVRNQKSDVGLLLKINTKALHLAAFDSAVWRRRLVNTTLSS